MSDLQSPPLSPATPAPQPEPKRGNGFGIAALVLGIVTVVGFAIPFVNYAAIATGAIGIVFAILGLVAKGRPRGTSIAGLWCCPASRLILSIVMSSSTPRSSSCLEGRRRLEQGRRGGAHRHVHRERRQHRLRHHGGRRTPTVRPARSRRPDAALPWTKEVTVKGSTEGFSFNSFTLSAMNGETGGDITARSRSTARSSRPRPLPASTRRRPAPARTDPRRPHSGAVPTRGGAAVVVPGTPGVDTGA